MNNLKNDLIRLGNNNPELREHIRPILKQASGVSDVDLSDEVQEAARIVADHTGSRVGVKVSLTGTKLTILNGEALHPDKTNKMEDELSSKFPNAGKIKYYARRNKPNLVIFDF
jgi:hypothetical protein